MKIIHSYTQHIIWLSGLFFLAFGAGSYTPNAYGNGTYGTCTYNTCGITLSSSSAVSLNVIQGASTTCTVQSDNVAVLTDSSTGYSLSINNAATTSSLIGSGANTIPTVSGTQTSPVALTANRWGYRVDGLAGFGTGPTSAVSNVTVPATSFAAIPSSSQSADVLAGSGAAADPAVATAVWYGVCTDTTIPAGTYSSAVVYTAVVN